MRKRLVVGNWKMHNTISQAEKLVQDILAIYRSHSSVELAVAPPFLALSTVARLLHSQPIALAAQNMWTEPEGAFTGEVSPTMLKDVGCDYVILGHSERRHIFGESNAIINEKIHAALQTQLHPIFCVGERLEERESNQTSSIIQQQLEAGLKGLEAKDLGGLTIAYEPVWAIGTGRAATVDQATEVHALIRSHVTSNWTIPGDDVRILYGGSVSPDNAPNLFASSEINGALVGKACLKSESFVNIGRFAIVD